LSVVESEGFGESSFIQQSIQSDYAGSWSIYVIDVDGDNDKDVVSARRFTNTVDWWKNNGEQNFSRHTVPWDGRIDTGDSVSSGTYLIQIESNRRTETERLLTIRL